MVTRHTLLLLLLLLPGAAVHAADGWQPRRTEFGQPDFQGVWFYGSSTPLERPVELGTRKVYSASEGAAMLAALAAAETQKAEPLSGARGAPAANAEIAQEADHNFAAFRSNPVLIDGYYRTSQIVSPADGRFPFRPGAMDIFQAWVAAGHGPFDGPEIRPVSERCAGPNAGPMAPMIGWFYNANMQVVQTRDHVMLLAEMNHDARIIPLAEGRHGPRHRQWMGNSRGHWEGDTLVVETAGFRPEQSWFGFYMSGALQVTERFTLIADDEIHYSYTFTDPGIYTAPVTVERTISRRPADQPLFEYACHEGNYSLPSILLGARRQELDARHE